MDLPTRLDLHAIGRRHILTRAKRIDPGQVDVAGSDANLFVGSSSYIGHALIRQLNSRVNALLLDGAEREDLDRYAMDRYRLPRKGAAAARVPVVLERATGAGGAGTLVAGTKLQSLTGIEYYLTAAVSFGSGTLSMPGAARAVSAGKAYQVGANAIRRFAVPPFDNTLTVNNPIAAAGGEDRESDDVFRERIRDFWSAVRRGTLGAIAYGARRVPGVESAVAMEVISAGIPQRIVELLIADSSGVANSALADDVRLELEEWRAGGIYVAITGSVPQIVDVVLALAFVSVADTVTLSQQIRTAVLEYINSLGVGQPLLRNDLGAVLARFKPQGLIATQGTVVAPTGDLFPDAGRTLRTTAANITVL